MMPIHIPNIRDLKEKDGKPETFTSITLLAIRQSINPVQKELCPRKS